MQDCRDRKIDMIITKSLSRFGRNTLDCLKSIRELKSLGVDVFFEKENIHTMRSEGELLLTLISAVAQNESLTLSENIKWGIYRKYERGHVQSIPSGKFLGYYKDETGNLVIDEEQAAVVRRIYNDFLNGYGYYKIAKQLTEDGVPTERGNKVWNCSTLKKILTNEKYMGDTRCQKTYNLDHLTKKRANNNGELPQYYYHNTHPAIIDRDIWQCVQVEFERQAEFCKTHHISTFHRHSEEFPLSGKITCGQCGHTYIQLMSKRKADLGKKYWRCSSFKGENGQVINGQLYTQPRQYVKPSDGSRAAKYRAKRRKPLVVREMLCTDITIDIGVPEKAFITAWNQLVDEYDKYLPKWQQIMENGDELQRYRARELMHLVKETGHIDSMANELMLKTLDYIEVGVDGSMEVVFLAGIRI